MSNTINDPGLGSRYNDSVERMIDKHGRFNIIRKGEISSIRDLYQFLIRMGWLRFNSLMLIYFILVNAFFAALYVLLGKDALSGIQGESFADHFLYGFYFSVQTFTSVGYGSISPVGHAAGLLSSFEAIFGLMSFALATGLLYGRFSKPKARLVYSENAIVAPYKGGQALMFRVANHRSTVLMEMNCTILVTLAERSADGTIRRNYYSLGLEINSIHFFPLSWTIVHPIDEKSPFYGRNREQMIAAKPELMILMKGYDETFSQEIHSRYSYISDEFKWGYRFKPCFFADEQGRVTIDLNKISDIEVIA